MRKFLWVGIIVFVLTLAACVRRAAPPVLVSTAETAAPAGEGTAPSATPGEASAPLGNGTEAGGAAQAEATATPYKIFAPVINAPPASELPAVDTETPQALPGGEPQVVISASQTQLPVGGSVQVVGQAVNIDMPVYTLYVRDEDDAENVPVITVNANNEAESLNGTSQVVTLLDVAADATQVVLTFQGAAPGTVAVGIVAAGVSGVDAAGAPLSVKVGSTQLLTVVP